MLFQETTFENFYKITGYDVEYFLNDFLSFISDDSQSIIEYYSGNLKEAPSYAFDRLNYFLKESRKVLEICELNKNSFSNVADWNLLEQLEEIKGKTIYLENISKFLRSPIINVKYQSGININYGLPQNQTLEKVSRLILGSSDFDNDWAEIAIDNSLREEDYGIEGGVLLKVVFDENHKFNYVESVIDNIEGEKICGLDINKRLTFVDDDLETLGYSKTIEQAFAILLGLQKGDNPEFPSDGITKEAIVGNSIMSLKFPIIFRQYYSLFAKDDTFSSFCIKNVGFERDAVFVDVEAKTTYGENLSGKKIFTNY